jgi:hypothetical protein
MIGLVLKQFIFAGEGKAGPIVQGAQILRGHPCGVHFPPVESV